MGKVSQLPARAASEGKCCRRRFLLNDDDMPPVVKNLMDSPPGEAETFQTLLDLPGIRLEQIVSNGQTSEEGFWYNQKEPEWVMLVHGEAVLRFDPGGDMALKPGDFLTIPANTRHRVESVSGNAVWLAMHFPT